ncbi:MAG: ATP-binding protein [Candidatus Methanomethyliaceae archaeon]
MSSNFWFREALTYHNITEEKARSDMLILVKSIELENPTLYKVIYTDYLFPTNMNLRWDFVTSTGMTTDYPLRRNWTDWMAVREFVQNALDIEERLYGYDNIKINIYKDEFDQYHIVDRGPGINIDAFRLGGSDKKCYERGHFGEGLKVALAYFCAKSLPIYVFNRNGQVFKPIISPSSNLILLVIGRSDRRPEGTEVIFRSFKENFNIHLMIFQEWLKKYRYKRYIVKYMEDPSGTCAKSCPNAIVISNEPIDYLWVRDIQVNRISKITGKPSYFGYNLWWVNLEPNRVSVASISDLNTAIALSYTPEAVIELLDRLLVKSSTNKFALIDRNYFESGYMDWFYSSKEVKQAVAKWVNDHNFAVVENPNALDWYAYIGVNPLLVSDTMRDLFYYAPTAEKKALELLNKDYNLAMSNLIDRESFTLHERINLRIAEVIIDYLYRHTFYKREECPQILVAKDCGTARGLNVENSIIIDRDSLGRLDSTLSVALHEFAHFMASKLYSPHQSLDLTREFEYCLTQLLGATSNYLIGDKNLLETIEAIQYGAWNVNVEFIFSSETHKRVFSLLRTKYPKIETVTHIKFPMAILCFDLGDTHAFLIRMIRVTDIIPREAVPLKEAYMSEVMSEITRLREEYRKEYYKLEFIIYDPWENKFEFPPDQPRN